DIIKIYPSRRWPRCWDARWPRPRCGCIGRASTSRRGTLHSSDRRTGPLSRCPEARELLPGYVEGELTAAERTRVSGHLALCHACRREEAQYRAALGLLNAP